MPDPIYTLPNLPYDYAALEPHISGRIMELHHDKHHAAYVKGANAALARVEELRSKGDFSTLSMLEKNLAFNVSGHVLHSVFWTNLSPDGGGEPSGLLASVIHETFGGLPLFADTSDSQVYLFHFLFAHVLHSWTGYIICAYVLGSAFTYAYVFTLTRSKTAAAFSGRSPSTSPAAR